MALPPGCQDAHRDKAHFSRCESASRPSPASFSYTDSREARDGGEEIYDRL